MTEAAVLLAMARVLLTEDLYDRDFVESWVNWRDYMRETHGDESGDFDAFVSALIEHYRTNTHALLTKTPK